MLGDLVVAFSPGAKWQSPAFVFQPATGLECYQLPCDRSLPGYWDAQTLDDANRQRVSDARTGNDVSCSAAHALVLRLVYYLDRGSGSCHSASSAQPRPVGILFPGADL